jgi:hypothetical protein
VLDVSLEGLSVRGSLDAHRLSHPREAHRGYERHVLAPVLGHPAVRSLPLGALDLKRSIEMCVPLSSTNTSRLKRPNGKPATATNPSPPRRVLGLWASFFERPPSRKAGYLAAHRRLGDIYARLVLEGLAMLPESEIGVGLQLPRQPLPQGLAFNRGSAGDLHRLDASSEAPPVEPALDGG